VATFRRSAIASFILAASSSSRIPANSRSECSPASRRTTSVNVSSSSFCGLSGVRKLRQRAGYFSTFAYGCMQPIDSSLAPLYVIGKTSQAHLCTPPNSACGTVRHAGSGLHGPYRPSLRRDHTQRDDPSAESRRQGLSLRYRAHGRTGRQPDEHLFAVVWITFLWRVREYPILAVLPVTTRTKRDRLGELVGDVVPFIVSKPG